MKLENALPSQRLKLATANAHLATEQLLGLNKNGGDTLTGAKFRQLSRTNYFVWSRFREELHRQKTGWWGSHSLLIDTMVEAATLDFIGKEARDTASPIAYPSIIDEYSMIGSLYVHLGSLLGGRVIRGMLERNKELRLFQPFHFYAAGATFSGGEWRSFVTRLNEALLDPRHLASTVAQADKVFDYYQKVYLESENDVF